MAKNYDLEGALGKSAQVLARLSALVKQIEQQGGKAGDLELLMQDRILERVARVLAHAGRLNRSFDVLVGGKYIEIFLIGLKTKETIELDGSNCLPTGCRFATRDELRALLDGNRDLLTAEYAPARIIGQRDLRFKPPLHHRCTIEKVGGVSSVAFEEKLDPNNLYAVTFR